MKRYIGVTISYFVLIVVFLTGDGVCDAKKPVITIGYMPVTAHLTIPIAFELHKGEFQNFSLQLRKYTSWDDMVKALEESELDGAFMPAPLIIKFREKKFPFTCVSLGCENGSAIVMGRWSGIENIDDLKGRVSVVAVPHIYSIPHIILYRYLLQNGVKYKKEVKIVSMSPADMFASLSRKETQGFVSEEPICRSTEERNAGKIIACSKEIWPSHPGGVLMISNMLIEKQKKIVQELVDAVVDAADFIEYHPQEASEICSGYYGVDSRVVFDVLTRPDDMISFNDLIPKKEHFERIIDYLKKMKLVKKDISVENLIDTDFIENAYKKKKK